MGRARAAGALGHRRRSIALRRWIPVLLLSLGCGDFLADFDRVVAIEILGSPTRTVEEGDTLQLTARAISASGEIVPDAEIFWAIVDTGAVGFVLDTATGLVTGTAPGSGRAQPRAGELRAGFVAITVTAAADSVAASSDSVVVVDSAAAASPPLAVTVYDLTTTPGEQLALSGQVVHFQTADPAPGSAGADGFFLTQSDTVPGADAHHVIVTTGTNGAASVVVRRQPATAQPDSAVIHAVAITAAGDTVAGSPVRFRVRF